MISARPAVVGVLAVLAVLAPALAVGAAAPGAPAAAQNETAIPGGPGAVAGGVVAAHDVRVDATVRRTALHRDLRTADTDSERAAVLAAHLDEGETRLAALRERQDRLEAARENGTLSAGAYAARAEAVWAGAQGLARLATDMEAAAAALPARELDDAGVEEGDVDRLRDGAASLAERSRPPGVDDQFGPGLYADIEALVANYNASVDGASRLGRQLRGERVDLIVTAGGARAAVSFRVGPDGRIADLRAGRRGDATLVMRTDRATVARLAGANDTAAALRRAVRNDDVRLAGVGPVNAVKWAVVDRLAGL